MDKQTRNDERSALGARQFDWGWQWRGHLNWVFKRLAPKRSDPGAWGEWIALLHLRRLGWDILARNWRIQQGEIDLVALHNEILVFVEVKTRQGKIRPEENFSDQKQRQMEGLSDRFRVRHELEDRPFRCDLIAIETVDFCSFELRHWIL